ncbi:hypothetical protein F4779DRAFT_207354 [Xylariaceae sp. FL0662B]|nr:hypothetical protein F4779DRAFT_207354 [Xylariaceae sp. FL0662B]
MPNNPSQRRTQFSSCDACRRSRVACDASKLGHQLNQARWTGSCSRCSLRKRPCTFEWINHVRRKPSNPRRDETSHLSTTETGPLISCGSQDQAVFVSGSTQDCDPTATQYPQRGATADIRNQQDAEPSAPINSIEPLSSPATESAGVLLSRWSDQIFHHGFETIFGLLVGRDGCPFVDDPTSEVCIPATKLFRQLDADMDDELGRQDARRASEVRQRRRERESQIDQSLSRTIRSFTARWLPLASRGSQLPANVVEEVVRESWRAARKDMLKVVNRTSYRSALTLYLFAQTPIPVGISEEEELDGISGLVCIHTALLQVQRLRERQRSHQFDAPELSARAGASASPAPNPGPGLTQAYLDFESRAYWAAVVWDTSNSLTLNLRTSLTSGLNGACSEPAWRLARTFLAGSFCPMAEYWRANGLEISDGVYQIIGAAAVCRLYVWKNITSLKEALREGVDEESLLFVWNALLGAIDIFETSIRPLLNRCERRLHFLDQVNRLGWYEVNLQYYQGILVLVDAIEAANRSDLLSRITEARQDAEHESFNVLKFGMENTYTIYGPGEDSNIASELDAMPREAITASFVAIDPYPNCVVDSVLLMDKVIGRKYRQGEIKHGTYAYLSSILLKALGQLPQSSKAVQAAQGSLQQSLRKVDDVCVTSAAVGGIWRP